MDAIRHDLTRVLGDVRAATTDWKPALAKVDAIITDLAKSPPPLPKDEIAECKAFLEWIRPGPALSLLTRLVALSDGRADFALPLPHAPLIVLAVAK